MIDHPDFAGWLSSEIYSRGWTIAEFARRAGVSASQASRVVNGDHRPGPEFCHGVAVAFNIPIAKAFRFAGLLPSFPVKNLRASFLEVFDALSEHDQEALFHLARMMRVCGELEAESK